MLFFNKIWNNIILNKYLIISAVLNLLETKYKIQMTLGYNKKLVKLISNSR